MGGVREGVPYSIMIPLFYCSKKEMDSLSEANLSRLVSGKKKYIYIYEMSIHNGENLA